MDDLTWRLLAVGLIGAAAVALGIISNRGRAWVRHHRPGRGLDPALYLLSSAGCSTCALAKSRLVAAGLGFEEVGFEVRPEFFARFDVDRVPAIVAVSETAEWVAFGVPSAAALCRWLPGP
jgi:hypothetical protein